MFDEIFQTFRQPWLSLIIFPFYSNFREVLIVYLTRCLWNVSKVCCVSLVLLISFQLMLLMAWQKFPLFWKLYNLLYTYVSFYLICLAMWNTGKWSDISVMNNPSTELFISRILWVNILSINAADVAVTLEGRVISGKKPLLDIISTSWGVCAWFS